MRTTLKPDEDAAEIAKDYASVKKLNLGRVVSDLLREGIEEPPPMQMENGIAVLVLPPDSPVVTTVHVRRLLDADY